MGTLQELPGQELIEEEQWAQRAACDLLVQYFKGSMELSTLEQTDQERSKLRGSVDKPGMIIHCFSCAQSGSIRDECPFCHGVGKLLVFPASTKGE